VNLIFAPQAWEDYLHWQKTNPEMISRTNLLIKEIMRNPRSGIGKPEPLKHALHGYWSRRLNSEHRIVYKVLGKDVWIAQLRYYYC
jgi:toxin YoeB